MKVLLGLRAFNDGGKIVLRSGAFSIFTIYNLPSSTARACSARARVFSVWISGRVSPRRVNRQVGIPYITHGFLRADSRNSMGFILLYGKKNVSRYGFRHSVLEATRRPVCHVILQRCAGRDMLDDAAAEAQLAEADELLTAVGFVQYLPRRWAKPGCEDKFWQGAAAGMDVLAFGLCACTKLDGMETTNTGGLSVYLAHSADYEQITVSTVPAKKTNNSSKAQLFPVNGKGCAFYSDGWKVLPLSCDREGFCRILVTHPEKDGMIN